MDISSKRKAANQLLESTEIWPRNYNPLIVRLLWKLGIDVPPPHLANFWWNVIFNGTWFGIIWGLLMWFFTWSRSGASITSAFISATLTGMLFGFFMAGYYAYIKRKHRLPSWNEFNP